MSALLSQRSLPPPCLSAAADVVTTSTLAHDTYQGQVLTCVVVVVFVAVFLLREWCLQNVPQAVEGLEDAGDAPVAAAADAPGQREVDRGPDLMGPEQRRRLEIRQEALDRQLEEIRQRADTTIAREQAHAEAGAETGAGASGEAAVSLPNPAAAASEEAPSADRSQSEPTGETASAEQEEEERPLTEAELRDKRARRFDPSYFSVDDSASHSSSSSSASGPNLEKMDELMGLAPENGSATGLKGKEHENAMGEAEGNLIWSIASGSEKGKAREIEHSEGEVAGPSSTLASQLEGTKVPSETGVFEGEVAPSNGNRPEAGHEAEGTEKHPGEEGIGRPNGASSHVKEADAEEDEHSSGDDWESVDSPLLREQEEREEVHVGENEEVAEQDDAVEDRGAEVGEGLELDLWPEEEALDGGERFEDEDDLDGVMEAIGMRGPVVNLMANMAMMFVLCSMVLTFFVALPYLIGRLFGTGRNIPLALQLPIRAMRLVTDPAFDAVIRYLRNTSHREGLLQGLGKGKVISSALDKGRSLSVPWPLAMIKATLVSRVKRPDAFADSLLSLRRTAASFLRSHLVILASTLNALERKTKGTSTGDRVFCVALGHSYWILGLLAQARIGTNFYARLHMRWLKNTIDQEIIMIKVLFFILLELAVFPWGCGLLLDYTLLPLWPSTTMADRWQQLVHAPVSISFTHWTVGTLYMFALAQFVASTRSVLRPGALCFVRDAGDPNFHPIKEILERRSTEQLRRISVSALLYSAILASTLGVGIRLMKFTTGGALLPLHWQPMEPISSVGFEIIFVLFGLPSLVSKVKPEAIMGVLEIWWWKSAARRLRLSEFLLGKARPQEEGSHIRTTWRAWLTGQEARPEVLEEDEAPQVFFVRSGGHARVPADDRAVMSTPIIVRVDRQGQPLDNRGHLAIQSQEEAIEKMKKKATYRVVYIPPHFKARIVGLFALLWASITALVLGLFFVPLVVGRLWFATSRAMAWRTDGPVHDGLAYVVGATVICVVYRITIKGFLLWRKVRKLRHRTKTAAILSRLVKVSKRQAKRIWLIFAFGVITPAILGLTTVLYVNVLIRYPLLTRIHSLWSLSLLSSDTLPDLSLLHAWSFGLVAQELLVDLVSSRQRTRQHRDIDWSKIPSGATSLYAILELRRETVWRNHKLPVGELTRRGLLPTVAFYLELLLVPTALLFVTEAIMHYSTVVGAPSSRGRELTQHFLYLINLLWMFLSLFRETIQRRLDLWTSLIKDEVFLISTELKNYSEANQLRGEREGEGEGEEGHGREANGPIPEALLRGRGGAPA